MSGDEHLPRAVVCSRLITPHTPMKVLLTLALVATGLTLSSCASGKCMFSKKKGGDSCCSTPAAKGKKAAASCCSH